MNMLFGYYSAFVLSIFLMLIQQLTWARSISSEIAVVNLEQHPLERETPAAQSLMLFADKESNDAEMLVDKSADPFDQKKKSNERSDTPAGMHIRVRVHPNPNAKSQQQQKENIAKSSRTTMAPKITSKVADVEAKIDEYGEDPFEGVTQWPLPEFGQERTEG